MPDPEETTDEVVDTPVDEVDEEQPDEPQDEDVGALKRAYERVKEERRAEKEIWDNEEAVFARVKEKFPHWLETVGDDVPEDDDDEIDDDEPQDDPRLAFVYQQEIKRQIDRDVNEFVGDRELNPEAREWVIARAQQDPKGFNPNALKRAVDDWFSLLEDFQPKKPKPKSHQPLKSGGPATEVPDLSDRAARRAYMYEEALKRAQ